jgi:TonB family protein
MKKLVITIMLLTVCSIQAQTDEKENLEQINQKVTVRVKIDKTGTVTETRVVCGDEILGKAAERAAKFAKFAPTLIDGEAEEVSGIIIYNFSF